MTTIVMAEKLMEIPSLAWRQWLARYRERRALQQLDPRCLAERGWSQADVEGESSKPAWVA